MKAKKTIRVIITAVVIVGAMAAAFALGASGKFSMVNPHDRLVGVLITTQPWPDGEDRVYAEYVDGEYVLTVLTELRVLLRWTITRYAPMLTTR